MLDEITRSMQRNEDVDAHLRRLSLPQEELDGLVKVISQLDATLVEVEPRPEFAGQLRAQLLNDGQGMMRRWRDMPARVHIAAIVAVMAGFLLLLTRKLSGSEAGQDLTEEPVAAPL